ncbi:MAG: hypothetical protein ABSF08_11115 [Candidatus Cybelea sp.]
MPRHRLPILQSNPNQRIIIVFKCFTIPAAIFVLFAALPAASSAATIDQILCSASTYGPDAGTKSVEFFRYPKGGSAYNSLTGFGEPSGAAISR